MYCSNCGNKLEDDARFCGNCGLPTNKKNEKPRAPFESNLDKFKNKIDVKNILAIMKKYFTHFYVDYNSLIFKWAMILFLATGFGQVINGILSNCLPSNFYTLFDGVNGVYQIVVFGILLGVFAAVLLNIKQRMSVERHSFLYIFWLVVIFLNALSFLTSSSLFKLREYVLFSNIVNIIITALLTISTALLLYINKPKFPIALIVSAISFAIAESSIWLIQSDILFYQSDKLWGECYHGAENSFEHLLGLLDVSELGYILLVVLLFLFRYLLSEKISKWLIYVPVATVFIYETIDLIKSISIYNVCEYVLDIAIIIMFVLFSLSCSTKIEYEYIVEKEKNPKKKILIIGIISVVSTIVIVISALLSTAIVCASHVNNGIKIWKNDIINGEVTTESSWDAINEDVFKYSYIKLLPQFIHESSFYTTLKENRYKMETITECYSEYMAGNVSQEMGESFSSLYIDDSWGDNEVLSEYYNKYLQMKPTEENVSVKCYINISSNSIEITVKNKNKMPIDSCSVKCDFTILFVKSGYSSNEYGRGTQTITVEEIPANSSKTEKISFYADDYYDGYSSYLIATVWEQDATVLSIE